MRWLLIGCTAILACARADVPASHGPARSATHPAETSEAPSTCDAFGPGTKEEAQAMDRGARAFIAFTGTIYQATEEDGCVPWRFEAREGGVRVWLPDEQPEAEEDADLGPPPCSFELEVGKNPNSLGDITDAIGAPPALIELGCTIGIMSTDGLIFARPDELRSDNYWLFRDAKACDQALSDTRWVDGQPCRFRN